MNICPYCREEDVLEVSDTPRVVVDVVQHIPDDLFVKYLKTHGTDIFTIIVDVTCSVCEQTQEQIVDIDKLIEKHYPVRWEE